MKLFRATPRLRNYSQFEDAVEDNSEWWTGDWDGDRDFTTKDLVLAMQAGAYNRPAAVAALAARERVPIAALDEFGAALDEREEWDKRKLRGEFDDGT